MKAPKRYQTNPVEVTAIQWTGSNASEIRAFIAGREGLRNFIPDGDDGPDGTGRAVVYSDEWMAAVIVGVGEWIVARADGSLTLAHDTFLQSHTEA